MGHDETWYGGRTRPRPHCVRWGWGLSLLSPKKGAQPLPLSYRPTSVVVKRSPISAITAEHLLHSSRHRMSSEMPRHACTPPSTLPLLMGDLNPHLTCGSLGAPDSASRQTVPVLYMGPFPTIAPSHEDLDPT